MIIGMDFGTTNSGMAVFDGKRVRMLPLDSAVSQPEVARTALYVTNDQTVTVGREAIDNYFDQNAGRPVKMKKVWVGEVEVYGADMYYVADVYAWIDVLSPGRLFLSIKSGLRDPEYQGTVVGQIYYSLENLIASYLSMTRMRAERFLGEEIREVVLGRPVRFSADPKNDELAQGRLLEAAFRAGYEKVYLQREPIAAAYHYAMTVDEPQNILVFDFGGGTLDITVMHLGKGGEREVLATGGIPIAGDVFDQKLVRAKLPKHFGEGSRYGPAERRLPLPKWIFDVFSNWQTVFELQTLESREFLNEIASTSDDKKGIEALISMVTNNYSLQMFDVVETAKRNLSSDMAALIRLNGPGFHVTELVTRLAFEQIIRNEIQTIDQHLDDTLLSSGLSTKEIDSVIRTGGSSNIPAFRYMLMDKFGREKVQATDIFSSVASGLGIIAHGISRGEIDTEAHTPAGQPAHSEAKPRHKVANVNLELLQKRMASQEGITTEDHSNGRDSVLTLVGSGRLRTMSIPFRLGTNSGQVNLPELLHLDDQMPSGLALSSETGRSLLLITSKYRFLLTTPGHLLDLQELGLTIEKFYQLKKDEQISAFGWWSEINQFPNMLLVTSQGYARSYRLDRLIESIEGPTPHKFDQPLAGVAMAIYGVNSESELTIVSDSGRVVRYGVDDFPVQGMQAFNRRDGEQIAGTMVASAGEELIVVTADGYARRMEVESIPIPAKPNSRGKVMIPRRPVAGIARMTPDQAVVALTPERLIPFDPCKLPQDSPATNKSYPIEALIGSKPILGLLSD